MPLRKSLSLKTGTNRKTCLIAGAIFAVVLTIAGDAVVQRQGLMAAKTLHAWNVLQVPLSLVGFFIGNELRKWLMPDAVYTRRGFFGLLRTKLFWIFGPQVIGGIAGWIAPLVILWVRMKGW